MPNRKQLSDTFCRSVKQPGRYGDGRGSYGLSLLVKGSSTGRFAKSFTQRMMIGGKWTSLGLGAYPRVTLAEARQKALENIRTLDSGIDPRKSTRTIPTFADAIDQVIAMHSEGWKNPKTAKRWRATLETYAMPTLGSMSVSEITSGDVMNVLQPIWLAKPETGRKVRERIGVVCKWAIAQGHRTDNPAGDSLTAALPKQDKPVMHQKALPYADVGKAIDTIGATDAWPSTKLAFEFLTLTATRSGETTGARWDEINLETRTWEISCGRMKGGKAHRIPLSNQALEVLDRARELTDDSGLIFPSMTGKVMTDSTVSKLLRENGVNGTPHGMRSSFRDWAAEMTDCPREICEFALSHVVGNAAELAYRRTDYFERRRELMQSWADYIRS